MGKTRWTKVDHLQDISAVRYVCRGTSASKCNWCGQVHVWYPDTHTLAFRDEEFSLCYKCLRALIWRIVHHTDNLTFVGPCWLAYHSCDCCGAFFSAMLRCDWAEEPRYLYRIPNLGFVVLCNDCSPFHTMSVLLL